MSAKKGYLAVAPLGGVWDLGGPATLYHSVVGIGDFGCGFHLSLVLAVGTMSTSSLNTEAELTLKTALAFKPGRFSTELKLRALLPSS